MARLTPIDYRMDVLNPMQMAMSGYQAGFGQMQQLDDVRRQREADRMAAEVHDMQMGQLEQAQAQAMADQQEMAIFIDALNKGGVTGDMAIKFSNSLNEKIAGAAQKIVTQEQQDKAAAAMNFAGEIFAASDSPDVLKQLLDEGIEAAFAAGDQEQLDYLQTLRQFENMGTEEGKTALNATAFLTAGNYASQLGDQGKIYMQGLGKIFDQRAEAAKGQVEQYASAMDALGVRRYTEGPNIGEIVPGFEAQRPQQQQMGVSTVVRPDGTVETVFGPQLAAEVGETGRVAPGYRQVLVELSDGTKEPVQMVIAGSEQEDAVINDLVLANQMVKNIDAALEHPSMKYRFGVMGALTQPGEEGRRGGLPTVPGTGMPEAEGLLQQILGATFLQSFEQLKGGGQITQIEGTKATNANTRLTQRGMTWEAAQKAMREMREVALNAQLRARAKLPPSTYQKVFGDGDADTGRDRVAGINRDKGVFDKYGVGD